MKHLKQFENIEEENIKEYIICKSDDPTILFFCLQIVEQLSSKLKINTITFDRNDDAHKSAIITANRTMIENKIVYQSDNIQDVIDMIKILKKSAKYNL